MIDLFWIYFACFLIMLFGHQIIEIKPENYKLNNILLPVMILASAAILAKGASMALDWQAPTSEQVDQATRVARNARSAIAVVLIELWPFALMLAGASLGLTYVLMLNQNLKNSN